ncbi:hypothetical protein [Rhodococcus sp. IEGM 1318]|uniref:hypothetical protein n=1 Tax=Rhodococcus sp. IEGM 1318 TaxID=3082226 RepID=UPI0029536EC7|nr:hypothetical protein [Rhodococcus sp. IEGM 1318]MDV8009311.1 hypothetical protein [Rhodococcus sp. IEGM 1318]
MDPLTLVAVAVALGASEGARETAKNAVVDSYGALKRYLGERYASVSAEVEGLEAEPDEELRRQLLAKKLASAGAGEDSDLEVLAQDVVRVVADNAPETAEKVGVRLSRVSAMGDIEITDVNVRGGSGVVAQDVATDGSIRISGVVAAESVQPSASSAATSDTTSVHHSFTSSQQDLRVGRDNITQISYAASDSGSNSGRVRAVTASAEKVPVGKRLWTVTVHNGTRGPITHLVVDVYVVDELGNRSTFTCEPAKGRLPLAELFRELLPATLEGTLDSVSQHAQSMPGMVGAIPPGGLSPYAGVMTNYLVASPQFSALNAQVQAALPDSFPKVLTAEQQAAVVYLFEGEGDVQVDISFGDEDGNQWVRVFGQPPHRAE